MSSLSKGLILLAVIIGIGVALVFWKSKVGPTHTGSFNSISKEEIELLLADAAKSNPEALKRFKDDPELKKQQLDNFRQLFAFASEAQKEGLANESPNKEELLNIRDQLTAVSYDKEKNKDTAMPPFGLIKDEQLKAFWNESDVQRSFWDNLKYKVGIGRHDREADFEKFLDTKIAVLKRDNPQMKDREISNEDKEQAKDVYAKIQIYNDEYNEKLSAGQISKEVQDRLALQIKLQQATYLARLYSDKIADKVNVTDDEIAKYISEHPELDTGTKRAKAEEILARAKNGEDFAALANEFSEDPGNAAGADGKKRGGLYEDVRVGQMVKPFEDAAMSLQPGQVFPNLVETDFGFHIIKLESKDAGDPNAKNQSGPKYSVRHILISTNYKDPADPGAREMPLKQFVRSKLEEEKQKKLIDDIVAKNHVEVPDDFDVPEISEQQIEESKKQQMQQLQQQMKDQEGPSQTEKKANDKTPEAKKPEAKKK